MRRVTIILAIATLHFATGMFLFLVSFGASLRRFETGLAPTGGERVVGWAVEVLLFPMTLTVSLWPKALAGPLEYVPFLLNSLLWGAGLSLGAAWMSRRRSAPTTF